MAESTDPLAPAYGLVGEGALREKSFFIDWENAVKTISCDGPETLGCSEKAD